METRMVLYSILYEKAKLQLMQMKREILQVFGCRLHSYLNFYSLSCVLLSLAEKSTAVELWASGVSNIEVNSCSIFI